MKIKTQPMILRRISEEYLEVELEARGKRYAVRFWDAAPQNSPPEQQALWEEEVYRIDPSGSRTLLPTDESGSYQGNEDAWGAIGPAWNAIPDTRSDYPAVGQWVSLDVPLHSERSSGHHPPGLLEKVNRDRARRRQRALAPGEWSTEDLKEFARHLRRNPESEKLKRRLMR